MKRIFFSICLISLGQIASAQPLTKPVQIDFENYFKGKPDYQSPFVALTALTWKYTYEAKISKNAVRVKFSNEDIVDKNRSWVKWERLKTAEQKERVLHHEQGHVNISFIMVKEAERVLANRNYSKKNYKTEIAELANSISDFFYTMQKNYDEETEHGTNRTMQARWDKIIENKLTEAVRNSG